jgi:hypothetical protein
MRYAPNDRRAFKHKKRRPAMKKISTVQAYGKEILKEQKLTIGVDYLGDRWSFYCVLEDLRTMTQTAAEKCNVCHAYELS